MATAPAPTPTPAPTPAPEPAKVYEMGQGSTPDPKDPATSDPLAHVKDVR